LFLQVIPALDVTLVPLNAAWWSLSTEVQFYVVLPLLPWVCRTRPRLLATVAACVGIYLVFVIGHPASVGLINRFALVHSLLGRAPLFVAGILMALVYRGRESRMRVWLARQSFLRAGVSDLLLLAVLCILGMLLRWVTFVGYWYAELGMPAWHIAEALCWSLVVLLFVLFPLRGRALVVNPALEAVGRWSYSIYLTHVPLLYLAQQIVPFQTAAQFKGWRAIDVAIVTGVVAVTLALSATTYRFIERPFLLRKAALPT